MLLLLDECVPRPLIYDLIGHDVRHVVDMGWSSKRNGELLQLMVSARFAALLTVDQNLQFQQNIRAAGVGVIVLVAKTNRIKELRPHHELRSQFVVFEGWSERRTTCCDLISPLGPPQLIARRSVKA